MTIREEERAYFSEGIECKGFLAFPEEKGKAPCVLVAHAWMGQDDFAREKAVELAKLGYIGFAADLYGNGTQVSSQEKAMELMLPLFTDRNMLRKRIVAAFEAAKKIDGVETSMIGAIGFCFGGQTVLELLRSGVSVKGVVSFHGVLGNKLGDKEAVLEPNSDTIDGACLLLHGHDDPMVSNEDLVALQEELTESKVDWQLHIFGHAMHAFTNSNADDSKSGLLYNETAAKRSWLLMKDFFKEVFV